MMKYFLLSLLIYTACTNKPCNPNEYKGGNWVKVDSTISYKMCSNNEERLKENDRISIEYLGVLKDDVDVLVKDQMDAPLVEACTNIKPVEQLLKNADSNMLLRQVLSVMTQHADCLVKIRLTIAMLPLAPITVYLKGGTDSAAAVILAQAIKRLPFVDTVHYYSSEDAVRSYTDNGGDSSWKKILTYNPLPASIEVQLKKNYTQAQKEELMSVLTASNIYNEAKFPIENSDILFQLSDVFKYPYLIRIKH